MLNPLEMNFYGTRNDGSFAYDDDDDILVPNAENTENAENGENAENFENAENAENAVALNEQREADILDPNETVNQGASYDGSVRNDGIGKWVDPDKGKRSKTDPYPSISSLRNVPFNEKVLPHSLQELFTPMKCNLCKCIMASPITAKDHYGGKKHKLNIRKWFLIHPEFQGETGSDHSGSEARFMDPNQLYCRYCDVVLSSEQQVESHYLGKKHQTIINGGVPKKTYYDSAKKQWEKFSREANEDGLGIGNRFFDRDLFGRELLAIRKCFCETCMVVCPSETTFQEHLTGAKHKKKVALSNPSSASSAMRAKKAGEGSKRNISIPSASDLSIYRTPTGKYYCSICNVTVNSPTQFVQHSDSKKHKGKAVLSLAHQPTKE